MRERGGVPVKGGEGEVVVEVELGGVWCWTPPVLGRELCFYGSKDWEARACCGYNDHGNIRAQCPGFKKP